MKILFIRLYKSRYKNIYLIYLDSMKKYIITREFCSIDYFAYCRDKKYFYYLKDKENNTTYEKTQLFSLFGGIIYFFWNKKRILNDDSKSY